MKKIFHKDEEVVYIEYVDNIPNSVLTASANGILTTYDFEIIQGNKRDLRYYQSGMGGNKTDIHAPHFVTPRMKRYWMAEGCKFRGRTKAINCRRIDKPIQLRGYFHRSINPFKIADESSDSFTYCKVCRQYTCDGDGCRDHQHWDDEQSAIVYNIDGSIAN